jgi:hypothetical protein
MVKCALPSCSKPAKSPCSICLKEQYCSGICLKADWKARKVICPTLKKLSNKLQSFQEVMRTVDDIRDSNKMYNLRLLLHLKAYAEHQVGERVPGIDYRQRADGESLNNWDADIYILHKNNESLSKIYYKNNPSISRDDAIFPCLKQSLDILNAMNQDSDSLDDDNKDYLLQELYDTELGLAMVAMNRRIFDLSEGHCQRCLAYSRRFPEDEEKISSIFNALQTYCILRERQGNIPDALNYAEECCNLVVETYDPVRTGSCCCIDQYSNRER